MQTIITKYRGATNTRPSKITATASGGARLSLSWDHGLDADGNHERAALTMMERMDWRGEMISGSLKDGALVWTFIAPLNRRIAR